MKKLKYISLSMEERAYSAEEKQAEEKIRSTFYEALLMPRLNIEKNKWWNEQLYGYAKADFATEFPRAINMAATFNAKLINAVLKQMPDKNRDCELDKQIAAESIVLLKNEKLLPLSKENVKKIALVGFKSKTNLDLAENSTYTPLLDGLKEANEKAEIEYIQFGTELEDYEDESLRLKVIAAVSQADIVIFAVGQTAECEREANDSEESKTYSSLSKLQREAIEVIYSQDKPAILLNFGDSWMGLTEVSRQCDAVFQCWEIGQYSGEVTAKMIFGDYQPTGKLPVTFYQDIDNLQNCDGTPLYPFGYGLTYSFVEYYRIYISKPIIKAGEDIAVTIFVKNKGKYETKDVVQAYLVDEEASQEIPIMKLAVFKKVILPVGEEIKVSMTIKSREMALINKEGESIVEPGRFSIYVGGGQPDDITARLYNRDCLHIGFLVE